MIVTGIAWLLWTSIAAGGTYFIEGPPVNTRSEVAAMVQVLAVNGEKARIVHRYRQGRGWEYLFVIEGFEDKLLAAEVAEAVATQTGRGVWVYTETGRAVAKAEGSGKAEKTSHVTTKVSKGEGKAGTVTTKALKGEGKEGKEATVTTKATKEEQKEATVTTKGGGKEGTATRKNKKGTVTTKALKVGQNEPVVTPNEEESLRTEWPLSIVPPVKIMEAADDIDELIALIVAAHRGPNASGADSSDYLFRFIRHTPTGLTVVHTVAKQGTNQVLDIDLGESDGVSSRLLRRDGGAWLTVAKGQPTPAASDRVQETINRFIPERVLSLPYRLQREIDARGELAKLRLAGTTSVNGESCLVLKFDGDRLSEPFFLAIDDKRHLLRQLAIGDEAGAVVQTFSDYRRTAGGELIPFKLESWSDGVLIDQVEVLQFIRSAEGVEDWFNRPE